MNSKIKQVWIEKLRSGEYSQGKNELHSFDNKFCCLGVLCDIYLKEHNQDWIPFDNSFDGGYYLLSEDENDFGIQDEILTEEVAEWAELNDKSPLVKIGVDTIQERLTVLNDQGYSFSEIADFIQNSL